MSIFPSCIVATMHLGTLYCTLLYYTGSVYFMDGVCEL